MREDTGTRTRDKRRFFLPPIRDLQDQRVQDWDNGCKFFISQRRKCQWQQQAIDSGDDRGTTAVLVAGRTRSDDSTAPGRRCQTTWREHAAAFGCCQYPHPAGDTRLRDEVSRYRPLLLWFHDTENDMVYITNYNMIWSPYQWHDQYRSHKIQENINQWIIF